MPLVLPGTAPVITSPPGGPPAPPPPSRAAKRTLTLIGPNGDLIALSGATRRSVGYRVGNVVRGLDMPPVDTRIDEAAGDGGRYRGTRRATRTVDMVVKMQADDPADTAALRARLAAALDTVLAPAQLIVTRPDGTTRRALVYYAGGAEGETGWGVGDPRYQEWPITLRSTDPYFEDLTETSILFAAASSGKALLPAPGTAFFPIRLSSSTLLGSATVNNDGTGDAYPVWMITPPGGPFTLRNLTTGRELTLTGTITQPVTIDTRPGIKTVRYADGTNLWARLNAAPQLWTLAPGLNSLELLLTASSGATTPPSSVLLTYRRRWAVA